MSEKNIHISRGMVDINDYGVVNGLRHVLLCRASQLDNPGPRDCSWCPYKDEDGSCADLEIMRDALQVLDEMDLFNKKISDLLNEGYSLELGRLVTGSNKKGGF